jgi:hypothetical protein
MGAANVEHDAALGTSAHSTGMCVAGQTNLLNLAYISPSGL